MNSRAEKPNVPTPDAASVYAHHLSQMSRPMRVAVERYVAELTSELERERVRLAGCGVAALGYGEKLEPGTYGHSASYDDVMRLRENVRDTSTDPMEALDSVPNDDPTKQRMRDEQDAELAGYARERADAMSTVAMSRDVDAALMRIAAGQPAKQPAPSPAAGAVALPDGLGAGWTMLHPGELPEAWEHTSGARILHSVNSGWFGMHPGGHDAHHGYVATAAEAARLALGASTAPAVVRGDGAGVDSGLRVKCDRCSKLLTESGALYFRAPDGWGMVRKMHVCTACQPAIDAAMRGE